MDIVFHIGANSTDGDQLVRSLVKSAKVLADHDVAVPGLTKYRKLIREMIEEMQEVPLSGPDRDSLLPRILDGGSAKRLVLSNPALTCLPARVFDEGRFYPTTVPKVRALADLFAGQNLRLCFALRNPATFIPASFAQVNNKTFRRFMSGSDPRDVVWSEVIAEIRAAAPHAPLTVWCNEDTPLIWSDILRHMTGVPAETELPGDYDLLQGIMSAEGMTRFRAFLATHPPKNRGQLHRIIAAFLDKYVMAEEIEEEVDLPGWDAGLVHDLTRRYEDDIVRIGGMDGVHFLHP